MSDINSTAIKHDFFHFNLFVILLACFFVLFWHFARNKKTVVGIPPQVQIIQFWSAIESQIERFGHIDYENSKFNIKSFKHEVVFVLQGKVKSNMQTN